MPALKNPKYERFARLIVQGMTQVDAYRKCYPDANRNVVNSESSTIARKLEVKARIAEMREVIDNYCPMQIGEKRDLLRRMIDGTIPTKVIRKSDGKIDAIFDRMAALQLDAKLAGEFAPEQMQIHTGPTLKLDFHMVGRNTNLSPAMEAEWKQLVAESQPEVKALPEPPEGQQEDFTQYQEADIRPAKVVSLDSLKEVIDNMEPEPS
jgi:hypothetical protein